MNLIEPRERDCGNQKRAGFVTKTQTLFYRRPMKALNSEEGLKDQGVPALFYYINWDSQRT